ncbi:MAG: hypothetical protein H7070_16700 [Saprospiraceae bacterium]|nr:hypothetical protein [Pyrinomonadaceae bacterium]
MQNENPKINGQYQTMIVLWAALLMSQLIFILLIFLTRPQLFTLDFSQHFFGNSMAQILGFALAAITVVILSFAFRKKFNERAVQEQNPALVQSGLIIACALCEASSLFGLALAFAFDYQYFFFWFALGITGILLHFPRKDALLAASYKKHSAVD